MIKRLLFLFLLFPVLPLATACGDNGSTDEDPVPSDPREECLFSNLKAVPSSTSVAASAEYSYLGGFLVKENGFTCTADDGTSITVPCERSTTPACTISGLKAETSYELVCYVIAGGHTYLSEPQQFTTLESGEEPEPEEERVVFSALTVSGKTENSATVAASYTYEGPDRVTDAGFLLTGGGQSNVKHSCGTATTLQYTYTDLSANTSYEVKAYAVTPSKTWYGDTAIFTTDAASVAPPDAHTRHSGWAELPSEVNNGDYLYVEHACDMTNGKKARNFTACYSKSKLCPVWVAAPLHDAYAEKNVERKNSYRDDPDLNWEQVGKWDGYTRGHMLGSAERLVSREANSQVMYFSNIAPQLGQNAYFNTGGGQWNTAEDWVDEQWRGLADTCYQVVGCYWANNNKKVSGTTIPTHYFTVLLKVKRSAGKKWAVNCSRDELQCIALFIEHKSYSKGDVTTPDRYESKGIFMTVSELENKTGHKFFMNVPNAPKDTYNTSDWNF